MESVSCDLSKNKEGTLCGVTKSAIVFQTMVFLTSVIMYYIYNIMEHNSLNCIIVYHMESEFLPENNGIVKDSYLTRSQCTLSLPPENIRKPYGFLMFSESREKVHWEEMCSCEKLFKIVSIEIQTHWQN